MRRASQLLWRCLRPAASPAWSAAPARSLSLSLSLSLPLTTSSLASVPLSGWSAARSGWAAASSALRARARTVAAVALAAVPALALYDEGLARAMYFNAHALPCLAHYRLTERLLRWRGAGPEETDAALARLHELYAPMSLRIVLRLRGFYIKLAQLG